MRTGRVMVLSHWTSYSPPIIQFLDFFFNYVPDKNKCKKANFLKMGPGKVMLL